MLKVNVVIRKKNSRRTEEAPAKKRRAIHKHIVTALAVLYNAVFVFFCFKISGNKLMKDKFSIICFSIAAILASGTIAVGLASLGYLKQYNNKTIEVKGLSEKTVKADIGEISITFSNSNYSNLEELYKKRIEDKEKIVNFLKDHAVTDEEIVNYSTSTSDYEEVNKSTSADGLTKMDRQILFRANDVITVKTTQLEKIEKIKSEIYKLSAEGILLTYKFAYNLTHFIEVKLEMMKEASENALNNAKKFIEPYDNLEIGDVIYLKQGEVTIRAEDENEAVNYWDSQESKSINKKLRLVVRAGYSQKAKE